MKLKTFICNSAIIFGLCVAAPLVYRANSPGSITTLAATAQPNDAAIRQQNEQAIRTYFQLLSEKRMDEWLNLWAEDGVQDMPYSPAGFPKRVEGKAAIANHYAGLPKSVGRMVFPDLKIYPTTDPNLLFVEFRGEIEVLATGKPYNNTYAGVFQFRDGKVVLFREYYDPIVFVEAWGKPGGFTQQ